MKTRIEPKNIKDVDDLIEAIGKAQREIIDDEGELNEKIEALKKSYKARIQKNEKIISELAKKIFSFAETNREELTKSGKKTVKLPLGSISWRKVKRVNIADEKAVLAMLEALGLKKFIRIIKKVDKSALLKNPEAAKGIPDISISEEEIFTIKPNKTKVSVSCGTAVSCKTAEAEKKEKKKKL